MSLSLDCSALVKTVIKLCLLPVCIFKGQVLVLVVVSFMYTVDYVKEKPREMNG